jgi:hypothetical protein
VTISFRNLHSHLSGEIKVSKSREYDSEVGGDVRSGQTVKGRAKRAAADNGGSGSSAAKGKGPLRVNTNSDNVYSTVIGIDYHCVSDPYTILADPDLR